MLTLADQVHGNDHRIRSPVGNDKGFCGTGQNIDTNFAEKLSFGFGYVGITGSYNDIRRLTGEQTESHGADGLDPPQGHDHICTTKRQSKGNRRIDAVAPGRCTGHNRGHPGRFGGRNAHDSRSRMGKTPAGHIASGASARDQPLAQGYTRRQLGLECLHAFPLFNGKTVDLIISKPNIVFSGLGHPVDKRLDLFPA